MTDIHQTKVEPRALSSLTFRWTIGFCMAGSLGLIAFSLYHWGATEVREDAGAILCLTCFGAFWLAIATALFPWVGLSIRDDIVERHNLAALLALCGAVVSVALTFAGGNLGEGPSYWNNVFSAALGTGGMFVFWILLELGSQISAAIAEERDVASGLRLGGFLVAVGLVLSHAVAGDWHSELATLQDFAREGWMGFVLCGLALVIEWVLQPSRKHPFPPWPGCGLLPALLYLTIAVAWLRYLGPWEGMPK